jgi:hypothetical protein
MGNPLVDQGVLNRIRASVVLNEHPELNVTASFLAKEGIRLSLDGEATTYVPALTGAVPSPEPYQMITLEIALLKTQFLSNDWKTQMEDNSRIGDLTVYPDAKQLGVYPLTNCSIKGVTPLSFNGEVAAWVVTVGGYYIINNDLFDLDE